MSEWCSLFNSTKAAYIEWEVQGFEQSIQMQFIYLKKCKPFIKFISKVFASAINLRNRNQITQPCKCKMLFKISMVWMQFQNNGKSNLNKFSLEY